MKGDFEDWVFYLVSGLVVGLFVAWGIHDCNQQAKCTDHGGSIERYNFRTIYIPVSCGSNCTVIVPQEVSDWRCVGLQAERP